MYFVVSLCTRLKNDLYRYVNAIYNVLKVNMDQWVPMVDANVQALMNAEMLHDPKLSASNFRSDFALDSLVQVFWPLGQLVFEYALLDFTNMYSHSRTTFRYLNKFTTTVAECPSILQLVTHLQEFFKLYSDDILSTTPTFIDTILQKSRPDCGFPLSNVETLLRTFSKVIGRVQLQTKPIDKNPANLAVGAHLPKQVLFEILQHFFEPPGDLREAGPCHSNDHARIQDITNIPPHDELLSPHPPFVPANHPQAPHHLPAATIENRLDTLYRLLREDIMAPLRLSVRCLLGDLAEIAGVDSLGKRRERRQNQLESLLQQGGGRYRSAGRSNSFDLNLYTDVEFRRLQLSEYHALVAGLEFKLPPSFARNHSFMRRLTRGNLVGLISCDDLDGIDEARIFLAIVTDAPPNSSTSGRLTVKVSFWENGVYLQAIRRLGAQQHRTSMSLKDVFLFEVPGFILATVEPFLKALKDKDPTSLPFASYLCASTPLAVEPPLFARNPSFRYTLNTLLKPTSSIATLELSVLDPSSIATARENLATESAVDPSQANALVGILIRELALVQGYVVLRSTD